MKQTHLLPSGRIERNIFLIRGQKVMLDVNLAELYWVETKAQKKEELSEEIKNVIQEISCLS